MAVLGAIMVDRARYEDIAAIIEPVDFYAALHETIYRAMVALIARGAPVDKISVADELKRAGVIDRIGGIAYLSSCMGTVQTASSAAYYAHIIREKAQLRGLIAAGARISAIGFEGEANVNAAIADAAHQITVATERGLGDAPVVTMFELLDRVIGTADRKRDSGAIRLPWATLTRYIGSCMPGELVGIVSAPAHGKSGCVLSIADFVSEVHGAVVHVALENGANSTMERHLAQRTGISARKQRLGDLEPGERSTLIVAGRSFATRPMAILGKESGSLAAIRRHIRTMSQSMPVRALIVDHISFLDDVRMERGRLTKHERADFAYHTLLQIANDFKLTVFAVQHFNREGMKGEPSMSSLANLRDGGNLEGHAHTILFPYRANPIGSYEEKRKGKMIIGKSRDGEGGAVDMDYQGYRHLWSELNERGDPIKPWFERKITFDSEPDPELTSNYWEGMATL